MNHDRNLKTNQLAHGCRYPGRLWDAQLLQFWILRYRRVNCAKSPHRCIQSKKGFFLYSTSNLCTDACSSHRFVDDHGASGLLHRIKNRLHIKRDDGPRVDHLHLETLSGEYLGRSEATIDHESGCHHCQRVAAPTNCGLSERNQQLGILGYVALHPIQPLVFEEDDRIRVADGSLQQTFSVTDRKSTRLN